jgi:hypothetical protein
MFDNTIRGCNINSYIERVKNITRSIDDVKMIRSSQDRCSIDGCVSWSRFGIASTRSIRQISRKPETGCIEIPEREKETRVWPDVKFIAWNRDGRFTRQNIFARFNKIVLDSSWLCKTFPKGGLITCATMRVAAKLADFLFRNVQLSAVRKLWQKYLATLKMIGGILRRFRCIVLDIVRSLVQARRLTLSLVICKVSKI